MHVQICNTVVRQTVNANAYPDPERRSDSVSTASSLPSRQASMHMASSSQQGAAPVTSASSAHSPGQGPIPEANVNGARGFSPPQTARDGTSRTAQLFALAEQYDLQGLEAAFEGMQSPHQPPTAQQGASPVARATVAQPGAGDSKGGRHVWVADTYASPQKLAQPSSSAPGQLDVPTVSNSTTVMDREGRSQVCNNAQMFLLNFSGVLHL